VEIDSSPRTFRAFVGVGSNIDPEENVLGALESLAHCSGVRITGISTIYRTKALPPPGVTTGVVREDPDYLNGVLELLTTLDVEDFLSLLEETEATRGRIRAKEKYSPRTLDLDLLLYLPVASGGVRSQTPRGPARPPHSEIRTRAFVAIPLMEVAPDLLLPPDDTPIREIASAFPGPGGTPEHLLTKLLRSRFLGD